MTTDNQQDVSNTAPLNGGIRQLPEPSDSVDWDSTSRESLPNNCDGGVPWPDEETAVKIMRKTIRYSYSAKVDGHIIEIKIRSDNLPEVYRALTKHKAGV